MAIKTTLSDPHYDQIQQDVIALVESSRKTAARQINALMTATYWEIGRRIVETEQRGADRATYGEALIQRLAADLTARLGRGFSATNLKQMRSFHLAWPSNPIGQTLSDQLTNTEKLPLSSTDIAPLAKAFPLPWSAYVALLSVRTSKARTFYETEALQGGWSVRQLKRQIDSQFYERTALSRDKAAMLSQPKTDLYKDSPESILKDPFVLEFLALKDEYSESDLEDALISRLADFLLEMGDDFTFVGRQRRLRLDDTWFRVDLVLFHRTLRCLIIIDLKVGRFSYTDAGQMHMYLNYAKEHWMKPGENPPVGLILAASKGEAEAHYALEGLPNKVLAAQYQTVLPDEAILTEELLRTQQALADRGAISSGMDRKSP